MVYESAVCRMKYCVIFVNLDTFPKNYSYMISAAEPIFNPISRRGSFDTNRAEGAESARNFCPVSTLRTHQIFK